jgi:hypothetical protein
MIPPPQDEEEEAFWQKAFLAAFQALVGKGTVFFDEMGSFSREYADIALDEFRSRHVIRYPRQPSEIPSLKSDEHTVTYFDPRKKD